MAPADSSRPTRRSIPKAGPPIAPALVLGFAAGALTLGLIWMVLGARSAAPASTSPATTSPANLLAGAVARAQASTVALEFGARDATGRRRMATGVVINNEGEVLSIRIDPPSPPPTEADKADLPIVARDSSGHRWPAQWVAADPDTGLTLLRVHAGSVPSARPSGGRLDLGAEVFVVGNPYGLGHSISRGHVAGLDRHVDLIPRPIGGLIQVQAPIHPGDSGAMLAGLDGGWIGLVRSGLAAPGGTPTPSAAADDFGFAIPSRVALWVADQLRTRGTVNRAYIGLKFAPDDRGGEGAEVDGVVDDSPAARSGLKRHDRVVRLDNDPIRTPDDLTDRLDLTLAGTEVGLDLIRDQTPTRLKVATGPRPWSAPMSPPVPRPATPSPISEKTGLASLPREVADRIERLERRIEEMERKEKLTPVP